MNLLALDAGNTRVKWALHDGASWSRHGFDDTVAVRLRGLPADMPAADALVASNVAGPAVADQLRRFAAQRGTPLTIIASQAHQCGVANGYRDPAQLGTDRWAALVGARAIAPSQATLVILAGTALTLDALDADGRHLGGLILPGARLMRSSLARGTAALPDAPGAAPPFPATTTEAIASGILDAQAGAIERFHRRVSERVGVSPRVLGAGGAIHELAACLPFRLTIHDNLVFDGLHAIARETGIVS
ncbi:MAG: type III pantothenate kinase [Betaproteobacteria bacterium]|nr:type III pantothenate kinase [Betaproteobacteria bacterium]